MFLGRWNTIIITLFCVVAATAITLIYQQSSKSDDMLYEVPLDKLKILNASKDQTLIVRLPSNTLLKYSSYKDVSILHFRVPSNTRRALFVFKAIEECKSAFQRKRQPRNVSLYLKARSYPVISPENITFPKNFLSADQRFRTYNLEFQSNEKKQRLTVEGPEEGNWFAVAFVSWTDPNNDRIEQQGLVTSCDTLLMAEMSVANFRPIIINNGEVNKNTLIANHQIFNTSTKENNALNENSKSNNSFFGTWQESNSPPNRSTSTHRDVPILTNLPYPNTTSSNNSITSNEIIYKFYVPDSIGIATAHISIERSCVHCPNIRLFVQPNAFPTNAGRYNDGIDRVQIAVIRPMQSGNTSIELYVQPNTWHYALLKFENTTKEQSLSLTISEVLLLDKLILGSSSKPKRNAKIKIFDRKTRYDEETESNTTVLEYSFCINFHELRDDFNNVRTKHVFPNTTVLNRKSNVSESKSFWSPTLFRDVEFYPLLRQTYRDFFMFDYDFLPDPNGTVPTVLNLTAGTAAGFAFDLGEIYDIGGTLSFAVSIKNGQKGAHDNKKSKALSQSSDRSGILAEKLTRNPFESKNKNNENIEEKILPRSNQTIIVCMQHGEPSHPTWPDKCRYGRKFFPATTIVNNTDSNTSTSLVHVPFPESGRWYITMGLYCHGAETTNRVTVIDNVKDFIKKYANMIKNMKPPCSCANNSAFFFKCISDYTCLKNMNETETLKIKECLMDSKCTIDYEEMTRKFEIHHKLATEQHFALENCNSSVVFSISSNPCVGGRCGLYGRCYHYMSGGFVFSTCVCMKGYRGWDCTEDSRVPSSLSILLASLLLTLSNLLFLPSIYIAAHRKYYTESVIYFFAMFFSIFYHACDSGEDEYSFCLVKIGVLQFCDFYCGLLAIWVTLVAMAHLRPQFVSLLHMFGSILLSFGTELNKQSLWVFLAPALTGICIIFVSWGMRCYKSKKWFPTRKYLTIYMPAGMVLVMVGLVCYAFLQTKQNYHIVHSIWHMVMALSILCLLPSRNTFVPKC